MNASIGPSGEVIALWSAAANVRSVTSTARPGWAVFPGPRAARPVTARVTVHSPALTSVTTIHDFPLAHPAVQPLPDGRVLAVGARARWRRDNGPDRNAIIYSAEGTALAAETLGDGIEHVFTTGTGHVWVGYFDEGVSGNYGWGSADGPEPMGWCGLARFSQI